MSVSRNSDKYLFPTVGALTGVLAFTALYVFWPAGVAGPAPGEGTGQVDTTGVGAGPQPVWDAKAIPGDGAVSVSWSNAPGTGSASYQVMATPMDEKVAPRECRTETKSCVLKDLTNGETYAIEVRSEGAGGALSAPQRIMATPYPAVLTSESSALWLDANDQSTLGGAALDPGNRVSEWRDKSGHGHVVTQSDAASQPLITALGERRALKFLGAQNLHFDGGGLPDGSTSSTIFAVARLDDPNAANSCFEHILAWGIPENGAARIVHKGCGNSMAFAETFNTWLSMRPTKPWRVGETALLSTEISESGIDVRMNGAPSYSWRTPAQIPTRTAQGQTFMVGGAPWWPNRAGWKGLICEVVILSGQISPAEHDQVEQYLARKWSIST